LNVRGQKKYEQSYYTKKARPKYYMGKHLSMKKDEARGYLRICSFSDI
jgi:hypothetical protein